MIRYLSGCSNPPTVAAAAHQPRLGMLAQPGNALHRQGHHYHRWALDCAVFGKAARGHVWNDDDTADYLAYLERVANEVDISNVSFAVAPDVLRFVDGIPIGDAAATWEQSRHIFPAIRALGFPVALVAQDGINSTSPIRYEWQEFDTLFIGGSDGMKLGPEGRLIAEEAKRRGMNLHMGRCNSLKRLRYAASIGCDSADGTFIGYGPLKNLPKVLKWLDATAPPPAEIAAAA